MKLCMSCGGPMNSMGDCDTPHCMFNPNTEFEEYDVQDEVEVDLSEGGGLPTPDDDMPEGGHDQGGNNDELELDEDEMEDLLNDAEGDDEGSEPEQDESEPGAEGNDEPDERHDYDDGNWDENDNRVPQDERESSGDESDEHEQEKPDHKMGGQNNQDSENEGESGGGQQGDQDDSEDSDDGEADDPDGDEQGSEPEDGDDHGDVPEDEDPEGDEGGDIEDYDREQDEKGGESDDDRIENLDDDDLPPRPQGCNGNCKEGDPDDEDAQPCPHCTAKRFRDAEKQQQGQFGDLTKQQNDRFDNLVKRITPKVKRTFGNTAEDFYLGSKLPGQFPGEDASQTIQIESRGVTYWVTIAAARSINDKLREEQEREQQNESDDS